MRLTQKELEALAWVADQDYIHSVRVEEYRDQSDVGWLRATISTPYQARGRSTTTMPTTEFKVSPLGHVYELLTGECLREGPRLF